MYPCDLVDKRIKEFLDKILAPKTVAGIICEQLGIPALTGKLVKGDDDSEIKERLLFSNSAPDFEDSSTLTTNNNNLNVTLM